MFRRSVPLFVALLLSTTAASAGDGPDYNRLASWDIWVDDKVPGYDAADLFTETAEGLRAYPHAEPLSLQPFGGLVTRATYSRYVLRLDYKWGEATFAPRDEMVRDAGICFHLHEENKIWPASVECQIQEGDTGDIWTIGTRSTAKVQSTIRNYSPTGDLVTRGGKDRRFARFHRGYYHEVPGWNHLEITVDGPTAIYRLNGTVVNEVTHMEVWDEARERYVPLTSGKILLQAEGAVVTYRNISITPLPPAES